MNYRKGVFVVVYLKDDSIKYLLLKRKLHWKGWEFPKGGVEKNETEKQATLREIKEETGLTPFNIKSYETSGKYDYNKKTKNSKDRKGFDGQSYQLYSVEVKNSDVKIDNYEHSSYKWLKFEDALKQLTWQDQKKCLEIVNSSLQ